MNKFKFLKIVLIFLFFGNLNAQFSSSVLSYPDELNEKFVLFTDRNFYAVNETVYFKAINNSHPLVKERHWSKVLYVELVNNKGIAAFKGKYILSSSGAHGSFIIPSDLQSDNYYLIAYTKWMRNFSPLDFTYLKVCVINPNKPYKFENQDYYSDSVEIEQGKALNIHRDTVNCFLPKSTFSKREQVNVRFEFPKSLGTPPNSYCISVVKKQAINPVNFGILHSGISTNNKSTEKTYIPELYGITISGSIVGIDEPVPISNTNVQLSVLGNDFDYFKSRTDSAGKFVFSLQPTCNKDEMFLSYANDKPQFIKILIDNEFFSETFTFPDHPFLSSENEVKIAEEIMFNMQINKSFSKPAPQYACYDTATTYFYGPPSSSIYIKDYVALPNLYEVFIELVPEVIVIKKRGERLLQVKGRIENHPYFTDYEPLVLIDMIPVSNMEELLRISPQKINHIDLVNEIYIKGDNIFGGIISIFSEKGDLAGIKLTENSMFFNYDGFTPQPNKNESIPIIDKPNIPDFRNNLFWQPDLSGKGGSEAQINFNTADVTGDYVILIRGLSEEGNIIVGSIDFQVK
jgi:hypothetical protein